MSIYNNISDEKYSELLSLINLYLEGLTSLTAEEIEERISIAYDEGEIRPTQYDHLVNSLY